MDVQTKTLDQQIAHYQEALEKSQARFQNIIEKSVDGMLILCGEGKVCYINAAGEDMLGRSREELVDKNLGYPVIAGESCEVDVLRPDGTIIFVEMRAVDTEWNGRLSLLISFRDITERKNFEDSLQRSLREKDAMLSEIHHRVKNNLQVISSLLSFQAQYIDDRQAIDALEESRKRVHSMAIIHEQLYRSTDFSRVDMVNYTQALLRDLSATYQFDPDLIHIASDLQDVKLDISQAIPLGLIINELVSNALKYAFPLDIPFPEGFQAAIVVTLQSTAEQADVILKVSDNGVGLPAGFDFSENSSMGLFLIETFTQQLRGEINWKTDQGTTCEIGFKKVG